MSGIYIQYGFKLKKNADEISQGLAQNKLKLIYINNFFLSSCFIEILSGLYFFHAATLYGLEWLRFHSRK